MRWRGASIAGPRARVAAVAVLLLGGAWWLVRGGKGERAAEWTAVHRDDLVLGVEVTGTLGAVESSVLGPPAIKETWNFKISSLAPEGAQVRKGEKVLGFDTSDLERKLEQKVAEADAARKQIEKKEVDVSLKRREDALRRAEAEARLRKATLKVDRPEELASANELKEARLDRDLAQDEIEYLDRQLASSREGDEAELRSLASQRDRAEQRVRELQEAIRRMGVQAPRDGTVVYASDWRDEKKKVGDSCWRGERVLEIPDLRRMVAKGEVDEADAGRIAEGRKVTLRLDAHPDVEFSGTVSSIWKTVQRKSWQNPLKVVRLDVALDRTDPVRMRPGMRFRGTIETGRIPRALVVPADAIFPTPDGPVAYRKTVLGSEAVPVQLGARNATLVEVLHGLREGDEVARGAPPAGRGREAA